MIDTNKFLLAAALSAALVAPAAARSAPGDVALEISGDRGWEVSCTFETEDGEAVTREETGRRGVETIAVEDVVGGECRYAAPEDGRRGLKITYRVNRRAPEVCPLTVENGRCVGRFAAGSEGRFAF